MTAARVSCATILVLAIASGPLGCGHGGSAGETFGTPEACFAAAKQALDKQDYQKYAACTTPASQTTIAAGFVETSLRAKGKYDAAIAAGGKAEQYDAVRRLVDDMYGAMRKHGIDGQALPRAADVLAGDGAAKKKIREIAETISDKPAFIGDVLTVMTRVEGFDPQKFNRLGGTIGNVTINGDVATADSTSSRKGPKAKSQLNFRKHNGGWLIHIED